MFRTTFQPRKALWLGVLAACVPAMALNAAEIHVPADYPTIQAALDASSSGDEIIVAPGTYAPVSFIASGSRTIRSSGGPDVTTIDGGGTAVVVSLYSTQIMTLEGFTIANGHSGNYGGGVRGAFGGPGVTIDNCIFLNNTATTDGGAIGGSWSDVVITNSSFIGNSAGQDGGAVFVLGQNLYPHIADCVFENNTAGRRGGAIANLFRTTLIGCTFEGNSAHSTTFGGGAIHVPSGYTTSSIDDCHFANNSATKGNGGAISMFAQGGAPSDFIINSNFTGNTAATSGGAVLLSAGARMIGSTLTGNTAATGGGAALSDNATIDNCTISENESTGDGGGVWLTDNASIINSPVTGNTAEGNGGGLFLIGATATDCPLTGNAATGRGGGVYAQAGASHLINCDMSMNTADTSGGGMYINDAAVVNLTDSTVCMNTPDQIDSHIGGLLMPTNVIGCEITCPAGDPIGACCLPQGGCATLSEADCIAVGGTYQGDGANCAEAECPDPQPTCIGDINLDGVVDGIDLLMILSNWGACPL